MKTGSASITLVLLLTIGVITVVSFSLGCTGQEETPAEPLNNTSVEPVENAPSEPAENASVESTENTSVEPTENTSVKPVEETTPAEPEKTIPAGPSGSSESSGIDMDELEPISADSITSIEWQWTSFRDSDSPDNQITVPGPENYTLALFADGTYYIKADCNSGSGTYTLEGNNLTLGSPVTTLVECGPDSMSGEYLSLLPTVEKASIENGQLILYPGVEGDKMFFENGGEAKQ